MVYAHGDYIDRIIEKAGQIRKRNPRKGEMKDPVKYQLYSTFKEEKYIPMKERILSMDFNTENMDVYEECAQILNDYYADALYFMQENSINKKSKFHTNFLEEFSVYFLSSLIPDQFDVFNLNIFAGLKINTDQTISQITKDVDFCVAKKIRLPFGEEDEDLIIPAISVEVKSYVDATMLGK